MGALQIRLNEIAECFTNEQSKLENLFEKSKSMSRRLEEQTGSLEISVAKVMKLKPLNAAWQTRKH